MTTLGAVDGYTSAGSFIEHASIVLVLAAAAACLEPSTAGAASVSERLYGLDGGTSSYLSKQVEDSGIFLAVEPESTSSNAGSPLKEPPINCQKAIADLRVLSGLTWDQVARLCGTTRRTLHNWASGKPTTAANEERLTRLIAALRRVSPGTSTEKLLLRTTESGELALDLLQRGEFDRFVQEFGERNAVVTARPTRPLSASAKAVRRPPAVQDLVDLDPRSLVHEVGPTRIAKPVRIKRGDSK